ncbi:MAG TPA: alanine racemase [Lentisphaeria bacterium]|nr:MAG: alanine racemase [Lentisphaerae bacterium GWF2_38_69]HBM16337.1 alanine racemase [Lentisphaeria bacterium]
MFSKSISNQSDSLREKWSRIPVHKKNVVWSEVSAGALVNNIRQIRSIVGDKVSIMAIVKADAYGHGAADVSRIIDGYVDYLGVSRLSEAVGLRLRSIARPIFIFGYTPPDMLDIVFDCNAAQAVHSYQTAKEYSDRAVDSGRKLRVHIKLDTGMGRLGLFLHKTGDMESYKRLFSEAVSETEKIACLPGIEIEGAFTHLSSVDAIDSAYAYNQLESFRDYLRAMEKKGLYFKYSHAAGTFSILNIKDSFFDMVRIGKSLYGIVPEELQNKFFQALTVKSIVSFIKSVPENTRISYAGAGITYRPSKICTVPFGFADGCVWQSVPRGYALVNGKKAPLVGRVCMDFMMLDISEIENVQIGDEVVITGTQKSEKILLTDLARNFSSTPSALATAFTARTAKIITD